MPGEAVAEEKPKTIGEVERLLVGYEVNGWELDDWSAYNPLKDEERVTMIVVMRKKR